MRAPRHRVDFWHRALAYHRILMGSMEMPELIDLVDRGVAVRRTGPVHGKAVYRITRYGLETAPCKW